MARKESGHGEDCVSSRGLLERAREAARPLYLSIPTHSAGFPPAINASSMG